MTPRWGGESGQAGGVEALSFGLLIFVSGTLLVATAWGVVDTKAAATAAAREGARTFVEAGSALTATDNARQAVHRALDGHGRDPRRATVVVAGRLVRCARVIVEVRYPVTAPSLPWIPALGALEVTARHSEVVDPYRSGLGTEAVCER